MDVDGEMCYRSDGCLQGGRRTTSGMGPEALLVMMMDRLTDEVSQESLWTMMFADDIVIYSETREQVEENPERWRYGLERRGMKVSGSKTEYMCENESGDKWNSDVTPRGNTQLYKLITCIEF